MHLEGIEDFQKTMMDMFGNLIAVLSQLACWLYHQIYVQGMSVKTCLQNSLKPEISSGL